MTIKKNEEKRLLEKALRWPSVEANGTREKVMGEEEAVIRVGLTIA